MKKLIYGSLFLTLVGMVIVGCKKSEIESTNLKTSQASTKTLVFDEEYHVASNGKLLVFESSDTYHSTISNLDSTHTANFLKKIGNMDYTQAKEAINQKNEQNIIGDDYLASILNEDWIVQIGDYLYRVNKPNEKVFALPAKHIDQYDQLVDENLKNANILVYSTNDDVIELVENGLTGQEKGIFCKESGIGGKESISNKVPIGNTGFEFWCYNDYNRYGIYFSLAVWVRSSAPNGAYRFYIQVENLWYHVRCGSTAGPYSFPWYSNSPSTKNRHKYQSYQGSKNLNGVHVKSRGRCEIPQGNTYTVLFTDWNKIQANNPYFP